MILVSFSFPAVSATKMLLAKNLEKTAKVAQSEKIPVAIFLVYHGLKSGKVLKEEVIEPALLSGEYDGMALFREIRVNEATDIIDFYGEPMQAKDFRSLYNITSLPAMVFVNDEGEQVAPALFAGSYDYYEFYLKRNLNQALEAMGSDRRFD